MIFRIGAHQDPAIVEMNIAQVRGGIWRTIEAPNADIAAVTFISSNVEELCRLREWQLYEITDSLKIQLLNYCLDGIDLADPPPIIHPYSLGRVDG